MSNHNEQKDIKGWLILIVCIVTLLTSVASSIIIRGNDLKHLELKVNEILARVVRIENTYISPKGSNYDETNK